MVSLSKPFQNFTWRIPDEQSEEPVDGEIIQAQRDLLPVPPLPNGPRKWGAFHLAGYWIAEAFGIRFVFSCVLLSESIANLIFKFEKSISGCLLGRCWWLVSWCNHWCCPVRPYHHIRRVRRQWLGRCCIWYQLSTLRSRVLWYQRNLSRRHLPCCCRHRLVWNTDIPGRSMCVSHAGSDMAVLLEHEEPSTCERASHQQ